MNSNQNQRAGMGSKHRKRSSIATKGNGSCLWRFINIFDSSIAHKLLAERKHERPSCPGASYLNSNLSEAVFQRIQERNKKEVDGHKVTNSHFTSVKDLIEKEMSKDKSSNAPGCNLIGNHGTTEIFKDKLDGQFNDLMLFARLISEKTKCRDAVEASKLVTSLAALLTEFDHISHQHAHNLAEHKIDLCNTLTTVGCKKHSSLDGSDSQLSDVNFVLQEAINVKANTLLGHKIADSIEGHGAIQPLEYMNALEILASNKELLLELVQDPNSFVFRLVQELKKIQATEVSKVEKCNCVEGRDHLGQKMRCSAQIERSTSTQIFLKQKLHLFLMKKDKFMGKYVSKSRKTSKEMSTTIGLAPCTTRTDIPCISSQSKHSNEQEKDSERFFSHFSFRDIKRRLRYIIRDDKKEQHFASRDYVLQRVPYWHEASYDTIRVSTRENAVDAFAGEPDKKANIKVCQNKFDVEFTQKIGQGILPTFPLDRESFHEARKHLFGTPDTTEPRKNDLRLSQVSEFSEKVLHLSDYSQISPTLRPHRTKELNCAPEKLVSSPKLIDPNLVHLSLLKQGLEENLIISTDEDVEVPVFDSEEVDEDVEFEKLFKKGRNEIIEIKSANSADKNNAACCNSSNIIAASVDSEHGSSCESWREEECWKVTEPGIPYEKRKIQIPSKTARASSSIVKDFNQPEFFIDKQDRPSPVSVFEPFFYEDDTSPDHSSITCSSFTAAEESTATTAVSQDDPLVLMAVSDHTAIHGRTCLFDRETLTKYVRGVLMDMDSVSWPSEQFFPPSLSDILTSQGSSMEDPKLLYDVVVDALLEIQDEQSQSSPWVSLLKPAVRPILKEDEVIEEVCKNIEKSLGLQIQLTLNEIMRMDMSSTKWMHLRLEMECIVAGTSMLIFEEMMEDIILSVPL